MIQNVSFCNSRNASLSGILNNLDNKFPVVILVHGFAGNKNENGLFVEAEKYFALNNINTFRFDFEGAGDSQGEFLYSNLEKQVEDFKSAIDYVSHIYSHDNIGVIGFSLGATVSLLANDYRIKAYSLWSPALFPNKDMFPRYNTEEINFELENKGFINKAGLKVGKSIINDLGKYSLDKIVLPNKPVLLIHGTNDPRINYQSTLEGKEFFTNAQIELIKGANHSYKNNPSHRKQVFKKSAEFFTSVFS